MAVAMIHPKPEKGKKNARSHALLAEGVNKRTAENIVSQARTVLSVLPDMAELLIGQTLPAQYCSDDSIDGLASVGEGHG